MLKRFRKAAFFLLLLSVHSQFAFAENNRNDAFSYYRFPTDEQYKPRNVVLSPIVSGILPGFDQWVEGQYDRALVYTGLGLGGFLLTQVSQNNVDRRYRNFGLQIYLMGGTLSLYHSFRSAVTTRRPGGDFKFLAKDESIPTLIGSALQFNYLGRWSTLFPLVSGLALYFLLDSSRGTGTPAEFGDLFYASSTSFMTGVSEELFFRGYMMPMLYHYTDNAPLSILVQGGAYGLLHGMRFNHFVTAFLFGLYSGWIVQAQDWELSEMIFVHTWLDMMAFIADYANHREPSYLSIPLVMMTF